MSSQYSQLLNFERFVKIPGVVDIRWISDDPDYVRRPEDLFEAQSKGNKVYFITYENG